MFQCAWCKKETNVYEWSKDKEPLCSECTHKYKFGLNQGMIVGNIYDLSKEQRRIISEKMNNFERFWGTMRSIEKEVLKGRVKILSHIIGWLLSIILIVGIIIFSDWFAIHNFLGIAAIITYVLLAYSLHRRIVWHIKYWQLKQKVKDSGYSGI